MTDIATKTARAKLKPAGKPYFHPVAPGLALGYRRPLEGPGVWCVRRADGKGGNTVKNLKTTDGRTVFADDAAKAKADGVIVMDFEQALRAAGAPVQQIARNTFTVSDAVRHYLKTRQAQGRNITSSTQKANAWIFDNPLGATPVCDLTREQVREWLNSIAAKPIKERRMTETDPEKIAAGRRATANRNLTLLKAALNLCYNEKVDGQKVIENDDAWRRLSPLQDAANIRTGWLNIFDAQRLERSCNGDFRTLVKGALLTGARYGQLGAVKVRDFNPAARTLYLSTRKGRSGAVHRYHVYLNAEGVQFFRTLCAGRSGDQLIFTNEGRAWYEGEQIPLMNDACDSSGIVPRVTFHNLRHTYASLALQATPPMTLLILSRNLGHKDTKQVERTYGHLAAEHIRDAVDASAPSFGFTAEGNVRALR